MQDINCINKFRIAYITKFHAEGLVTWSQMKNILKIIGYNSNCPDSPYAVSHAFTESRRGPTGCRCCVLVIRCNPMIMSDYDTL